jgi:hypothetical protein
MRCFVLAAAGSLALSVSVGAQERLQNFASLTSYVLSIPAGDTRDFVSTPSWFGLSWEGTWAVGRSTAAGVAFSVHDFNHSTFGTTTFPWGAATGQQTRTLLVTSAMATGRWYPLAGQTLRPHLGLAAGILYSEESYRLGVSQTDRSAVHLAIAPEAGWQFPLVASVDGLVSARYTIPTSNGNYIGGARSHPFATLSIGILER